MWLTLLALRNRIGILMLSLAMIVLGATVLKFRVFQSSGSTETVTRL